MSRFSPKEIESGRGDSPFLNNRKKAEKYLAG